MQNLRCNNYILGSPGINAMIFLFISRVCAFVGARIILLERFSTDIVCEDCRDEIFFCHHLLRNLNSSMIPGTGRSFPVPICRSHSLCSACPSLRIIICRQCKVCKMFPLWIVLNATLEEVCASSFCYTTRRLCLKSPPTTKTVPPKGRSTPIT